MILQHPVFSLRRRHLFTSRGPQPSIANISSLRTAAGAYKAVSHLTPYDKKWHKIVTTKPWSLSRQHHTPAATNLEAVVSNPENRFTHCTPSSPACSSHPEEIDSAPQAPTPLGIHPGWGATRPKVEKSRPKRSAGGLAGLPVWERLFET